MDEVATFATECKSFEDWLIRGTDTGPEAAATCLTRLLDLYRSGIALPVDMMDGVESPEEIVRVGEREWRAAHEAARRLPLDVYAEVVDPTVFPDADSVCGSLSDDLADIHRDIVTGLNAYVRGQRSAAVRIWRFGLRSHWGAHATSAIRALHWWLNA